MQFDAQILSHALKLLKPAVDSRATLPVLGCVYIKATDGWAEISATNLEIALSLRVPVYMHGGDYAPQYTAECVLDYKELVASIDAKGGIVTIDPSPTIEPSTNRHSYAVRQDPGEARVTGYSPLDFPTLATDVSHSIGITALDLEQWGKVLTTVVPFAAGDDTRPVLAGVELRNENNQLTTAAADGFQLGIYRSGAPIVSEFVSIVVPARAFKGVPKNLTGLLNLFATSNWSQFQMTFETKASKQVPGLLGTFLSRTIDGRFPDVRHIVPTGYEQEILVKASVVQDAAKRSKLIRGCASILVLDEESVVLAEAQHSGQKDVATWNHDSIRRYGGASPVRISFDPCMFAKMLPLVHNDELCLRVTTGNGAGCVTDGNSTIVLMPIVTR